ncbi:unnamed protein product [Rotaria socialis]|uniref:Uncharacterized protein n=1 Tax=Rotaria socialis TaxID=392032 RepID=A0A818A3V4_9BILA|nr:unnamed protein product [Rotaria socialis]CAF3266269.1 unnamed protein product [Rotaria socialis]CAF3398906.1 unnamed protein product [Rotaria socialis]CAF3778851.1 unnamed protein product [Rotaria socialis]CAF3782617.1 unnamed protein product [Rotaria socialis]
MAKKATPTDLSSSDFNDETSSSDEQQGKSSQSTTKKSSITNYVTDILTKHGKAHGQPIDLTKAQVEINTNPRGFREYENVSAFRPYPSDTATSSKIDPQRSERKSASSDEEIGNHAARERLTDLGDSMTELNLDPNPIYEERESQEQVYKQKVYLRQLQPPTPHPVEIQVQEVLIKPQISKPPIHVRIGQREPRTPSPIVIKTQPPPAPPAEPAEPIIYNKYIPPPKQPQQQIIIHRYPDLPPKPRPIVVEQWLPYKPAPKRIIKHSLPPEALQTPPTPHNIIVSYSKPRALIEVELVRLPVVKIDPQAYEKMSAAGQEQLMQNPTFQHEQEYLLRNRAAQKNQDSNKIDWRI